jgi:hypothetical protein
MSTPTEREAAQREIAALKAEIAELAVERKAAIGDERRDERNTIANMITAKENRLTELLKAQAAAAGNAPPVTSLHFMCSFTHVLISTRSVIIFIFLNRFSRWLRSRYNNGYYI